MARAQPPAVPACGTCSAASERVHDLDAIAGAKDPVLMAHAMKLAVEAGHAAFKAGRIPRKRYASASSPVDGLIG